MTFTVIDWIFGILILIFAIIGIIKGFINNIFGKLSWILGIILACFFYDDAAAKFLTGIENVALKNILAFVLIFIVVFLVVKILQLIISKIFEWEILKSLDRTLGFFFGVVEGLAVVGLIIFLLTVQPFFSIEKLFDGSFFYNLISEIFIKTREVSANV